MKFRRPKASAWIIFACIWPFFARYDFERFWVATTNDPGENTFMAYQFPPDVDRLIRDRMAAGGYKSEDDVLRDALQALAERAHDLAAIQSGIDDMNTGRTRPLAALDAEIRAEFGLAPRK